MTTMVGTRRRAPSEAALPAAAFIVVEAPWGPLHVATTDRGVVAIELSSTTERFVEETAARLRGAVVPDQDALPETRRDVLRAARRQLDEYFAGRRETFDVPLDLRHVSDWERRVLEGAASLRYGEVTSYGGLARRIGSPRAARAVGGALGRNPVAVLIPCHRIIAGDGTIGGYGGGHASRTAMLAIKRTLLAIESIELPASVR